MSDGDKVLAQEVVAGILLPALVAGFVVAGGTMLIERKGGIIGGVVRYDFVFIKNYKKKKNKTSSCPLGLLLKCASNYVYS